MVFRMIFSSKVLYEIEITDHNNLESSIIGFSKIPQSWSINDIRNRLLTTINTNNNLVLISVNTISKALKHDECLLFVVYDTTTNKTVISVEIKKPTG